MQLDRYHYRADGIEVRAIDGDGFTRFRKDGCEASPWISPLRMPRAASRITLEITEVRVERLQAISEADAIAEGVQDSVDVQVEGSPLGPAADRALFPALWNWLNAKRGYPWEADPWVWVLSFRRV